MNEHFCPNPFIYLTNSNEGKVKFCCLVHRGIVDNNNIPYKSDSANIKDVWNSNDLNNIRQQMVDGKALAECQVCYNLEKNGGGSLRKDLVSQWQHNEKFKKSYEDFKNKQSMAGPVSVEVRTGNICNLKCRMCYPTASVLIDKEYRKFERKNIQWKKINSDPGSSDVINDPYFLEVIKNFEHIDTLRFSGGEPFLNDSTNDLIAEAASSGHSKHIELFVNTNFTRITDKLLEDLSTFKTVNIDISLDGYKHVHEYIRSGLQWNTIEDNLEKIKPYLNKNFYLTTNTTVQNLNVLYLEDILKWTIQDLNITPVFFVLDTPSFLSVKNMPGDMKVEATRRIQALVDSDLVKRFKHPAWLTGRLTSIMEAMNTSANDYEINRFLYFTSITDAERDQDYRTSIPELASFYQPFYPIKDF